MKVAVKLNQSVVRREWITLLRSSRAAGTGGVAVGDGGGAEMEPPVEEGALLVVAPDPTVPYASSTFVGASRVLLAPGARCVVVEWLSSGRAASGERWAFEAYESRVAIAEAGGTLSRSSMGAPMASRDALQAGAWGVGPVQSRTTISLSSKERPRGKSSTSPAADNTAISDCERTAASRSLVDHPAVPAEPQRRPGLASARATTVMPSFLRFMGP